MDWRRFLTAFVRALPGCALLGSAVYLLGVRAAANYAGLPNSHHYFSYHPDEVFLLLPSFGFAAGDWNPHFFNYGTLYIYLVGIGSLLLGVVPDHARFPDNLAPLYLLGRNITLSMAVGGVIAMRWALRMEPRWTRQLGTYLLAFCPLFVVQSGYATVDVPSTFWLILAFGFTLRGALKGDWRLGALSGAATGLAAATKYSTALFLVPVLLAPRVVGAPRSMRRWYPAVLAAAGIAFLIGCPYALSPEFVRGVLFESRHMRIGGTLAFVNTGSGWVYHLVHGLPVALGFPLLIAVCVSIPFVVKSDSPAVRLSVIWVVLYLVAIGFARERFIRYLVPAVPFLCVISAHGLVALVQHTRRRISALPATVFSAAVVVLTAAYASGQMHSLVAPDPRDSALGAVTAVRHVGLVRPPWFSDPPVSPYNSGPFLAHLFEDWNARNGGRVVITGWDSQTLLAARPGAFSLSDLESNDALRLRSADAVAFTAGLAQLYRGRRVFQRPEPALAWLAPPRSWAPPDWLYPSPRITVYYGPRP